MILSLLPLLFSCTTEADRPELEDWSDGYESDCCPQVEGDGGGTGDGGTVIPFGDTFGLFALEDFGYNSRLSRTGATGTECEITPGESPSGYVQMDCTMDVPELDLFGAGLYFDFTVPAGACDHLVYMHYMYEAWEVGYGPSTVTLTVDEDGEIVSEENAIGGSPYCEYDYSFYGGEFAPNCCLGSYDIYTNDLASGETSLTGGGYWGGNAPDCYAGAAFEDPEAAFTADGWPTAKIINLWGDAYSKRFAFDLLGDSYTTNVNYANYFDRADHDGSVPVGFTGDRAVETYEFLCYDVAEELLGRLDMTVREWNEEVEWENDGDPDTEGTEPVSGLPLNDRQDWQNATPDATTWIQNAQ